MAAELEDAALAAEEATRVRNALILEAHARGETLRAIAEHVGMSWSGVRKIINASRKDPA